MHAQDQHRHLGPLGFEFLQRLQPAAPGHREIHDDKIPRLLQPDLDRLPAVRSFAKLRLPESMGEDEDQPLAHYGMIVGDKNLHE